MSWIIEWWRGGGGGESSSSSLGDAINASTDTIDGLVAKRMQLLKRSSDALREAKTLSSDRPKAMALMRQRKEWERQAAVYEGMILNMERTTMALDTAATSVQVAKTMKTGAEGIKGALKQVSVEDIDAIADDMDDTLHEVRHLTDALSRPMGLGGGLADEEEMDAEIMAQLDEWDAGKVVLQLPQAAARQQPRVEQPTAVATKNRSAVAGE